MEEVPVYEADPYRTTLTTAVTGAGADAGRPWVTLEETLFYPEGGGQPPDHGWLGEARVLDVQKTGEGSVRHYLDRALAAGPVEARLDWERRFDHMQHHTGQHLLSAVAEDRFGWATTSFHLGEDLCDVELDAPRIIERERLALEEAVAAEVRAARPVRPLRVPIAALGGYKVRSRGVPEGVVARGGDVRLVEIDGVDLNTCGGTHLHSTAEIEALHLLAAEPMRGGVRLTFVAGRRARRRLEAHEARAAALRSSLGVGDGELVAAAAERLERLKSAAARERRLLEELSQLHAAALAGRPEAVVDAHFPELDMVFLQGLGRRLAAAAPDKAFLLTGGSGDQGVFLVGAGEKSAVDPRLAGAAVATALGGRGGGSGRLYQGKAPELGRRAQALAAVRQAAAPQA